MQSASTIRQQAPVVAFDTTDHFQDYGFSVPNAPALAMARTLIDALASEAVNTVDAYFREMDRAGQNPYRERAKVGGGEVWFAAPVEIFAKDALDQRLSAVFSEVGHAEPKLDLFASRLVRELEERLAAHGFEIAAVDRHDDGTPWRIAITDPVYVTEARSRYAITDFALVGGVLANAPDDLGFRNAIDAKTRADAERFIRDFVQLSVARLATHLERATENGKNPFKGKLKSSEAHTFIVDAQRLTRGRQGTHVHKPAMCVAIATTASVLASFHARMESTVRVDETKLLRAVCRSLADELKKRPELQVGSVNDGWHLESDGQLKPHIVVLCVSDPPKKSRWDRLFFWKTQPQLALPAPKPEASLPAPTAAAVSVVAVPPPAHAFVIADAPPA